VLAGSAAGALAFWRKHQRRGPEELPAGPDPAEELRAKLAASKAAAVGVPPVEEGLGEAPPEPLSEAPALDPETRRRAVHKETRASMEELGSADA